MCLCEWRRWRCRPSNRDLMVYVHLHISELGRSERGRRVAVAGVGVFAGLEECWWVRRWRCVIESERQRVGSVDGRPDFCIFSQPWRELQSCSIALFLVCRYALYPHAKIVFIVATSLAASKRQIHGY